jgi:hypothetical protein
MDYICFNLVKQSNLGGLKMRIEERAKMVLENAVRALGEEVVRHGAVDLLLDNIPELKSSEDAAVLLKMLGVNFMNNITFDGPIYGKTVGHYLLSILANTQRTRFESVVMRVTPGGLPVSGFLPLVSDKNLSDKFDTLNSVKAVDDYIREQWGQTMNRPVMKGGK